MTSSCWPRPLRTCDEWPRGCSKDSRTRPRCRPEGAAQPSQQQSAARPHQRREPPLRPGVGNSLPTEFFNGKGHQQSLATGRFQASHLQLHTGPWLATIRLSGGYHAHRHGRRYQPAGGAARLGGPMPQDQGATLRSRSKALFAALRSSLPVPRKGSITCRISATRGRRHPILALQAAAARSSRLTAALPRAVNTPMLNVPGVQEAVNSYAPYAQIRRTWHFDTAVRLY